MLNLTDSLCPQKTQLRSRRIPLLQRKQLVCNNDKHTKRTNIKKRKLMKSKATDFKLEGKTQDLHKDYKLRLR